MTYYNDTWPYYYGERPTWFLNEAMKLIYPGSDHIDQNERAQHHCRERNSPASPSQRSLRWPVSLRCNNTTTHNYRTTYAPLRATDTSSSASNPQHAHSTFGPRSQGYQRDPPINIILFAASLTRQRSCTPRVLHTMAC